MEEMEMAELKITTEDIRSAMAEDPKIALLVHVKALTREVEAAAKREEALVSEVVKLTEELKVFKNGKNYKGEKKDKEK
jgi:hypothetical protein